MIREERGIATLEVALLLPFVCALVGALAFGAWLTTAHAIVAHGARVGARYAAVPAFEDLRSYPAAAEVSEMVDRATPLLRPARVALHSSDPGRNAPIAVTVGYDVAVPEPLSTLLRLAGSAHADAIALEARAEARRE